MTNTIQDLMRQIAQGKNIKLAEAPIDPPTASPAKGFDGQSPAPTGSLQADNEAANQEALGELSVAAGNTNEEVKPVEGGPLVGADLIGDQPSTEKAIESGIKDPGTEHPASTDNNPKYAGFSIHQLIEGQRKIAAAADALLKALAESSKEASSCGSVDPVSVGESEGKEGETAADATRDMAADKEASAPLEAESYQELQSKYAGLLSSSLETAEARKQATAVVQNHLANMILHGETLAIKVANFMAEQMMADPAVMEAMAGGAGGAPAAAPIPAEAMAAAAPAGDPNADGGEMSPQDIEAALTEIAAQEGMSPEELAQMLMGGAGDAGGSAPPVESGSPIAESTSEDEEGEDEDEEEEEEDEEEESEESEAPAEGKSASAPKSKARSKGSRKTASAPAAKNVKKAGKLRADLVNKVMREVLSKAQ